MAQASGKRKRGRKAGGFANHAILFVLSLMLMLLGKADIALMNSARSILTGLAVPVADIVSVPFGAVNSVMEGMVSVARLREENLRLKEDVDNLKRWRRQAEILQSENRQLRSVSGVIVPENTTPVSARAVAVNADSFAHSVMVNVGSRAGVEKGNAVTTTDGLVGIVVDTGPKHAQILLITDINAMVPVLLASSSWPAVTVGQNSKRVLLRFLPSDADVAAGDLLQTSGHGGVLPPGIPVGRIEAIRGNEISVRPVADLQRLGFVTILTTDEAPGFSADSLVGQRFQPIPPEEEGFSLEGLNALGRRTTSDVPAAESDQ